MLPTLPGRREEPEATEGARLLDMSEVFAIADRYVDAIAALDPISATGAGIAGHDDRLTDYSPAGAAARAQLARRHAAGARRRGDGVRQRPHRGRGDDGAAPGHHRSARGRRTTARPAGHREPGRIDPVVLRPHGLRDAGRLGDRARAHGTRSRSRRRASKRHCARASRAASSRRVARRSRAREQAETWSGDDAVLPQRRRPAPGRADVLADAAEAATIAYARARAVPPRRVRARMPSRATRSVRERYALFARAFNGIDLDFEETYQWGWDELYRIEDAMRARRRTHPARRPRWVRSSSISIATRRARSTASTSSANGTRT